MHFLTLTVTQRLPGRTQKEQLWHKNLIKLYQLISSLLFSLPRSLGVPCQLPPLTVMDAWAGQAGGAATGAEDLKFQTLAQLFAPSRIPHYHPAGRHKDDHWTSKGACAHTHRFPDLRYLLHRHINMVDMATHLHRSSLYVEFYLQCYLFYILHVTPSVVLTLPPVVLRVWKPTWSVCTSLWRRLSSTAAQDPSSTGSYSSPSAFFTASCRKGRSFYSWAGTLFMASTILTLRSGPRLILNKTLTTVDKHRAKTQIFSPVQ